MIQSEIKTNNNLNPVKLFYIIFIFSFLSGCSLDFDDFVPSFIEDFYEDSEKIPPLPKFETNVDIKRVWSSSYSGEIEEDNNFISLSILGDRIFFSNNEKSLYVVSSEDGRLIKKLEVQLGIYSGVSATEDIILYGSQEDTVTAVDINTNEVIWQRILSSEILAISDIINNRAYVRTSDSKIYAFDADTGEIRWQSIHITPSLTIRGVSKQIIGDTALYVGFDDGKVFAYNLDNGGVIWRVDISSKKGKTVIDRLSDIDGDIKYSDGIIYAVSYQGKVSAIDSSDGKVIWSKEGSSYYGIDVDDKHLFYTDDIGRIFCLDKFSGKIVWLQDSLSMRLISSPVVYMNNIFVADIEGYIHILNPLSGVIHGRIKLDDKIQSIVSKNEDGIFFLDKDINISKFQITEQN